jgi:hypothetical protein
MRPRSIITAISFALQISLSQPGSAGSIHAHSSSSPTEKSITDDISVFDGFVERRDEHPREFAHFHPYLTRLLNHPDIASQWISRWQANPSFFETHHHFDWIILERYFFTEEAIQRMERETLPLADPITSSPSITPAFDVPFFNDPPADPPAVPEPASMTLAITGLLSLAGLVATCRGNPPKRNRSPAS